MLVAQSCLTLCNLTQQTRLLCPWNSPGKNIGVDSHAILQGIFPTQGSNFSLPHCRQILPSEPPEKPKIYANTIFNSIYTIWNSMDCSLPGSSVRELLQARILEWVAISFSMGSWSQLFTWGGQSIGISASASVIPVNSQDWSHLGWTGWTSLHSKQWNLIHL